MIRLTDLVDYTHRLLDAARFSDYCPNGLQVEGRSEVRRIVTGVSASLALVEAAVADKADAILVHHGWFWRNEPAAVVGVKRRRLATLLAHELSLIAYHLPLDAHPQLGNNATLGRRLGFVVDEMAGEKGMIHVGRVHPPVSAAALARHLAARLGREPVLLGDAERTIERIAWCSGAAQGYFEQAAALGVDAYLTGEASEYTTHFAREFGVVFFAAGHHATERYGIEALGNHLAERFGLAHRFIDIDNPV